MFVIDPRALKTIPFSPDIRPALAIFAPLLDTRTPSVKAPVAGADAAINPVALLIAEAPACRESPTPRDMILPEFKPLVLMLRVHTAPTTMVLVDPIVSSPALAVPSAITAV